jgi:ribosomal protein S4
MRLDILITEKKLVKSRSTANSLIKKGLVKINGEIITKPAKDFSENVIIEILEQPKYVGRGGLKLERALIEFKINPTNLVVMDVGSSTGGFTDCLLQSGAKKVYACATHPVFSSPAISRIAQCEELDQVIVTDTIPISEEAKKIEKKQKKQHKEVLEVLETIEVILESGNSIKPNSTILRNAIKLALQKSAHPLNAISHE